jgi:hypothetical protein
VIEPVIVPGGFSFGCDSVVAVTDAAGAMISIGADAR